MTAQLSREEALRTLERMMVVQSWSWRVLEHGFLVLDDSSFPGPSLVRPGSITARIWFKQLWHRIPHPLDKGIYIYAVDVINWCPHLVVLIASAYPCVQRSKFLQNLSIIYTIFHGIVRNLYQRIIPPWRQSHPAWRCYNAFLTSQRWQASEGKPEFKYKFTSMINISCLACDRRTIVDRIVADEIWLSRWPYRHEHRDTWAMTMLEAATIMVPVASGFYNTELRRYYTGLEASSLETSWVWLK